MMRCAYCKNEIDEYASACPVCGAGVASYRRQPPYRQQPPYGSYPPPYQPPPSMREADFARPGLKLIGFLLGLSPALYAILSGLMAYLAFSPFLTFPFGWVLRSTSTLVRYAGPLLGLVYYFSKRTSLPRRASSFLRYMLVGFGFNLAINFLLFVLGIVFSVVSNRDYFGGEYRMFEDFYL